VKVPGLKTLRLACRWSALGLRPRALILGYHRIATERCDPGGLCVSAQNFSQQLEVLSDIAQPVSLSGLVSMLRGGPPPRRRVVVTFDDGYLDNLITAWPMLRRHRIPATVFVATGFMGQEFWWDTLARWVGGMGLPQQVLDLSIAGRRLKWEPARAGVDDTKTALLETLSRYVREIPAADQREALGKVGAWLGGADRNEASARAMSAEEISELAGDDRMEIGAHTVSHPPLARLSVEDQTREVTQSVSTLEEIAGRPVRLFSYPNGSFSPQTIDVVRRSGLECACSSLNGAAVRGSDPYNLPRIWVPNVPGDRFRRWLRWRLGP
jgi:peptidoglycan/xylan/chitin deacetylase (PgdA/CDA1 family)